MQLVVIATLLALVQTGKICRFECQPMNMDVVITTDSCNRTVSTTVCAGQCHVEDPLYIRDHFPKTQKICNGDWFYERQNIEGCEVDVPVARNCGCRSCNGENTDCRHMSEDLYGCLP
ncbi:follitropin subunit beta [Synchiropus splendidus]|uniref:follitropin subunit beta n=1 Tax=Synchiropus splendidus TaxID=270530 RepID=UPI00237E8218|nr:follitropin subunit beta [Synchiropus splendidus]